MYFLAYLGTAGLVDVGYRFYDTGETASGSRVTTGIVDAGLGWYSADATIPAGAASIRWDSTGTPEANAREDLFDLQSAGTGPGQLSFTAGLQDVNLFRWLGATPDTLVAGKVPADLRTWLSVAPLGLTSQLVQAAVVTGAQDWTATERQHIRNRLGIDGSAALPSATPTLSEANVLALVKVVTDRLNGLIENVSGDRYTAKALEAAPSGGAGGADWTSTEREHIRHRLGINGTAVAPTATPSLASQASLDGVSARVPTALVGGKMDSSVSAITTAAALVIWQALTTTLTTVGSVGKLIVDNLNVALSTISAVTNRLNGMIENVSGDRYTTKALEQAPAGGGGGTVDLQDVRDAMLLTASPPAIPEPASIDAKLDALNVSAGVGAFVVTTRVTDGVSPLQLAAVRVTEGANSFADLTDVNGQVSFSLNAATYTVSVTKGGYSFVPTTRTVVGNQSGTLKNDLVMSAMAPLPPPADAALCRVTGYFETLDNKPAGDIRITFTLDNISPPSALPKTERFVVPKFVAVLTDSEGRVASNGFPYVDLTRNDQIIPAGTTYRVECPEIGLDEEVALNSTSLDLLSLI